MKAAIASPPIYGIMAEFENEEELVEAVRRARSEGYRKLEAYAPQPIEGLAEEMGFHDTGLPMLVLIGGIVGALGGFAMQYYLSVINYPINVGGRPLNSWPAFIPVTFETTILLAALTAVFGMLALNGLPMPYHPVFNVDRFARASRDRFFLCIRAIDPRFSALATRQFLESCHPRGVYDVDH
jgi:hypothetical protein